MPDRWETLTQAAQALTLASDVLMQVTRDLIVVVQTLRDTARTVRTVADEAALGLKPPPQQVV